MPKKQTKSKKPPVRRSVKSTSKQSRVRKIYRPIVEADSTYLLKLVVIVIVATIWLKFRVPLEWSGVQINALPVGIIAGLLLVKLFEKSQTDRKIWYAVLLVVGIVSYFLPAGIVL